MTATEIRTETAAAWPTREEWAARQAGLPAALATLLTAEADRLAAAAAERVRLRAANTLHAEEIAPGVARAALERDGAGAVADFPAAVAAVLGPIGVAPMRVSVTYDGRAAGLHPLRVELRHDPMSNLYEPLSPAFVAVRPTGDVPCRTAAAALALCAAYSAHPF